MTDQPTTPDTCCVCGGSPVVYRNYQEQPFCAHCSNCACGTVPCTRPTPDSLREQYAAAIRPNMLMGLQDAELDGPGGTQRINEWVDWIAKELATVRDREMEQLRARVTELEQQLADADGELTEAREHNDRTCEAVAARDQAEAAIERVREVHRVSTLHDVTPEQAAYCVNCRFAWPCPTTTVLDDPQQPTTKEAGQ